MGIWKIENVGNDILEVKLHVGCAWEVYGLNGRCERMRGVVVRCIWWPFGDPELPMSCGVALSYMWVAFGSRLEALSCI